MNKNRKAVVLAEPAYDPKNLNPRRDTKIDAHNVHIVRSDYTDAEIATFATSYVTAENMLSKAAVGADDTVLVTGASGGVGSALIQLAKRRGARVIGLASRAKHKALDGVGADILLDRELEITDRAVKKAVAALVEIGDDE